MLHENICPLGKRIYHLFAAPAKRSPGTPTMLVGPYCVAPEPHHCYSALAKRNPGTPTLLGRPLGHSPRPRHPTHRSRRLLPVCADTGDKRPPDVCNDGTPLHVVAGLRHHSLLAYTYTSHSPSRLRCHLRALTDTEGNRPPDACYDVHRTSLPPRSTLRCHLRLTCSDAYLPPCA